MPYRTHAWLAQHEYALSTSSAQLVSSCELPPPPPPAPPPPPQHARLPPEATGFALRRLGSTRTLTLTLQPLTLQPAL